MKSFLKFRSRDIWYCFLLWIATFVMASAFSPTVFYLTLPLVIFWTCVFYFRRANRTLYTGLWLAGFWFFVLAGVSVLEIIGPYYRNFVFYISDIRNIMLFPFVLLIPFIYALVLENRKTKRGRPKTTVFKKLSAAL